MLTSSECNNKNLRKLGKIVALDIVDGLLQTG